MPFTCINPPTHDERIKARIAKEASKGMKAWDVISTPLRDYALPPIGFFGFGRRSAVSARVDAKSLLAIEISKAAEKGERAGILDVGAGTGKTWRVPLARYGASFGLCATTLCDCKGVWEGIRPMLTFTNAASVHLHYPKESFCLIFSHYGLHNELRDALPAMLSIAKKGGQIVLSGIGCYEPMGSPKEDDFHSYLKVTRGELCGNFRIVKHHHTSKAFENSAHWFLWLEKTG